MAELHGKNGDVTVGGSGVTGVSNWTISYDGDIVEVTDYSDAGIKAYIAGGTGWTGTFQANKNGAPETINTEAAGVFKESDTAGQVWNGQIIITNISTTVDIADKVVYSYTFTGTGALTVPTA